jgi:DNA-binding beta-propeller fold protein YncE
VDTGAVAGTSFLVALFTFIGYLMVALPLFRRVAAWVRRTPQREGSFRTDLIAAAVVAIVAVIAIVVVFVVVVHRHEQAVTRERQFALPFTGLRSIDSVAVDAAGSVYVTDPFANQVLKLAPGSNTPTALPFTGLNLPTGIYHNPARIAGVTVDTAGNVYVIDTGNLRVLKLAPGSNTQTVLPFNNVEKPVGVAVDRAGDVYVVDLADKGRVLKLAAGSSTPIAMPSMGGVYVGGGLAVDAAGTVYASVSEHCEPKCSSDYLMRLAPGADAWTKVPPPGGWAAIDAAGNVYAVERHMNSGVLRLAPGSSTWTQLAGAVNVLSPVGLAVDAGGNVYVADDGAGNWFETPAQAVVLKLPAT